MKETINKTKRQPSEGEKIFANNISSKRLISKLYKELIQLNLGAGRGGERPNNWILKVDRVTE